MPGPAASRDRTGTRPRRASRPTIGARERRVGGLLRRAGVAGACLVVVIVLGACIGSPSESRGTASPRAGNTTSSAVTSTPPTAAAPDPVAVATAYRQFLAVAVSFVRSPESQWRTTLGQVAVDPQLAYAISVSRMQRRYGITLYGQTKARAPKVSFSGTQQATVRDCADFSHTGQADARTGRPRTVGVARTPLLVMLLRGGDGRWRVSQVEFPGGRC